MGDEASLAHPLLTSCCVARFLTGHGPVTGCRLGVGDPCFRSFIVSGLTFRSLTHFEFVVVCGVRECSYFILLHVAVQFSQHHLLTRMSFLYCIFLPPLS